MKNIKEITSMKEFAIIKRALELYVATLSEEYDNKQTRIKLIRLEETQACLRDFNKLGEENGKSKRSSTTKTLPLRQRTGKSSGI
jgi:hypothetical protein